MENGFDYIVATRYHIYNSLFLNLPYSEIYRTGTLLPLLQQACDVGFTANRDPKTIIKRFISEFTPNLSRADQFDLLFKFIQYAERQVVLFDAIEDAAFEQLHDLNGRGTVTQLLQRASSENKIEALKQKLETFSVRPVLTAHPTQFYAGNVLAIINDLERAIHDNHLEHINLLLRQLSKTAFINRQKPTPFEEALSLCWFLENVFYHAVPGVVEKLIKGLKMDITEWTNFNLFKIGFWPGGDRDGNPYVTHETTVQVALQLRRSVMKCYHRDLRILRRRLTFKGVEPIIQTAEQKIYRMAYPSENTETYQNAEELLADLFAARKILSAEHGGLFLNLLDDIILKVKLFGFYLASMDIRQDSRKHGEAWEIIIDQLKKKQKDLKGFYTLKEAEQVSRLLKLKFRDKDLKFDDPFVGEFIESIKAIKTIQQINGPESCHRYVISNCRSAIDVIRVFQLARLLISDGDKLPLDIVPLFETIEDLERAPTVMKSLYEVPAYRQHLEARGKKQTIMLGFSDGTKDGGFLRANWSIYCAKELLTSVTREQGFTAVFFDGRGGPPARGGGNTHDFYASLGDTIEDREVQLTIQGQTISSNFGNITSCSYNLEQLLSVGVENETFENEETRLSPAEKKLLTRVAMAGHKAYLKLKKHPSFVPYLEKVTPLRYFSDINIGSRPVKRNAGEKMAFEDLRAIPFVGSWALMKQNIPGFYGVGSALRQLQQDGKLNQLKNLYKRSLFFRTLVGNSMMSLTKTYYPATLYLSKDREFGAFWKMMHREYNLSKSMVLEVSGMQDLLENNPINRDSIKLRERIVLPLIGIQQYALQNLRNVDAKERQHEDRFNRLVLRCMFGIVNAARNSA